MITEDLRTIPMEAPTPVAEPQPLSLSLLVRLLKQRKRTILLCGGVALSLAAILAYLLPTVYTAETSFVPPGASNPSSAAALMGQLSALGAGSLLGGKTQGDLYVGILRSHTIGQFMVDRFGLKQVYQVQKESSAEGLLAKKSEFDVDPKSSIITVLVTDKSAQRARDLAEGYLIALQQTTGGLALTESSQRRSFYEQRLAQERDALADAEIALKRNQEKTGLIAPAGQTATQIASVANLRAQITGRQVELAALLRSDTEENPDVVRLRAEITALQAQASQTENGQSDKAYGNFSNAQVPELELDYIRLSRDVKYHEALFEIISKQYEAARIDEAKSAPLQILDHATLPDTPSGPRRKLIMAAGLLAGLILGASWVLIRSAAPLTKD